MHIKLQWEFTWKVAGFEARDGLAISSPGVAVIQYGVNGEQLPVVASSVRAVPGTGHRIPVLLLLLLMETVIWRRYEVPPGWRQHRRSTVDEVLRGSGTLTERQWKEELPWIHSRVADRLFTLVTLLTPMPFRKLSSQFTSNVTGLLHERCGWSSENNCL